jgi:hypothetical protein
MTSPAAHENPPAYGAPGPWQGDEPPAPPGPGVAPPFVAAPTDRDRKTVWIGLGIGALVFVLCCVGGIGGVGVFLAGTLQETRSQAKQTVGDYLDALQHEEYSTAYDLRCEDLTAQESLRTFTARVKSDPVLRYTVGTVDISGSDVLVSAVVQYSRRGEQDRRYVVAGSAQEAGGMTICSDG